MPNKSNTKPVKATKKLYFLSWKHKILERYWYSTTYIYVGTDG